MEEIKESSLKSILHDKRVWIRIVNCSHREIDIMWIDYVGKYVKFAHLKYENFIDINTFETHPWIAVDPNKGERLLLGKQFVYVPRKILPKQDFDGKFRIIVPVTNPIYNLRFKTLLEIRSYLNSERDVDALGLPKRLQNELKFLVMQRKQLPNFDLYIKLLFENLVA